MAPRRWLCKSGWPVLFPVILLAQGFAAGSNRAPGQDDASTRERCPREGCTGTLQRDGLCDTCILPAPADG